MQGEPLAAAKAAAERFASFLGAEDRLSVVVFDDTVDTIFGPAPADGGAAARVIREVCAGGSTNLSGGWLKGKQLVSRGMVDGTNRVVMLTDGQANVGVVEPDKLVGLSAAGSAKRVSTTCIGFGAGFNERLLEPMAKEGGGNYWYVESVDQMEAIFQGEIEGLVALGAQNVEIEVSLTHAGAAGVTFLQSYPVQVTPEGTWRVALGDLYATSPRTLGLLFHVENVAELGKIEVARVRIEADVVTESGIEHRTVTMPVMANLDGDDHIEPIVEQSFLRFATAKAREESIVRSDRGDFNGAAARLREAAAACAPYMSDPNVADDVRDLTEQAMRLENREYTSTDRKYNAALAMASMEDKVMYVRQVRRRREPPTP
jgi:Ca-activated chloride channel family protein